MSCSHCYFVILIFTFSVVIALAAPPRLVPLHKQTDLFQHATYLLSCNLMSGKNVTFEWHKDGNKLTSTKSIHIDNSRSSSLLTFTHPESSASGQYECKASNADGEAKTETKVVVHVPPSWIKEPKDVNLRMGEEYSVECVADGMPKPNIKWVSSSGQTIEGEVLDLGKLISNEKHGRQTLSYECIAENGIGDALRKSITISYNVPVKFEEKYSSLQVKRGESIVLRCNATGDQPIAIKWTNKDGAEIDHLGEARYEVSEIPTKKGVLSELHISSVHKSDGAIYKCEAENLHGKDERTIKLAVVEEPGAPLNVKINEVWSRSASISWRAPYNGNSPINRYVVQYWRKHNAAHRLQEFNVSSSQTSALIKNLSPGMSYEMSIIAENEVGRSEPSDSVQVYTGEEEPTGFPLDLAVEPLGPTTVRITWRAPPRESWNGVIKGYYVGYRKSKDTASAYTLKSIDTKYNDPAQIESEKYEYFLRDLLKGSEYEVVLKAFNMAGSGPQSHVVLVRTQEGDLPPAQHLAAVEPTANTISLRWSQKDTRSLSTPITSYTVHYQKEGETKWREIPLSSLSTTSPPADGAYPTFTYMLQNLEAGAQYRIFVTAINRFGFSDPSNIVIARTTGEQIAIAGTNGPNNRIYSNFNDAPYYLQPAFTIPILVAFVIVFIIVISAYVCIRRIKARAAAAAATTMFVDAATMNKHLYATTPRYTDFDKVSGKPLILTEQGNIFPTPYATMPMDDQNWNPALKKESHIYDAPT